MSKANSLQFTLVAFGLLAVIILTSCYGFSISDLWTVKCSDMPSEEEVHRVRQEHDNFFEELQEEGLIWSADVVKRTDCRGGAYIIILHGGEWQKPLVLEKMDDLGARSIGSNFFFEVPFRFLNV